MSNVLGVGVVMHVLHLPDVVLIGAARGGVWSSWEGRVQVVSVLREW